MIRKFVETDNFQSLLKSFNIEGLERDIKNTILSNPQIGDLIKGTGGLRKFRFADSKNNRGKSGSFRVLFLDLPKYKVTYLIFIFPKSFAGNITPALKQSLKIKVQEIKDAYSKKK
ncbi:MAG: hypothetical protein N4A33_00975 [Bacteriovoracaceae bacterium]|jgi:hypothetical protein|nr:hypothetical protein [Bacteriovoracaceae bacterium]